MSGPARVLVVAATELELGEVRDAVERPEEVSLPGRTLRGGTIRGLPVAAVATGIGKVNAAVITALAARAWEPDLVLSVGVGGGFAAAGVHVGDLAVATSEHYGDEGVETDGGWQDLEAIGFPLHQAGGVATFNDLPVDPEFGERLRRSASQVAAARSGPFVTVSTVTGTARSAAHLHRTFGAICESMEGAAVAHACLLLGLPFAELRGISNPVGPRDRASWQLAGAACSAQAAALHFLKHRPAP